MEADKADHLYRALIVVDSGARKKQVRGSLRLQLAAWQLHSMLCCCAGAGIWPGI